MKLFISRCIDKVHTGNSASEARQDKDTQKVGRISPTRHVKSHGRLAPAGGGGPNGWTAGHRAPAGEGSACGSAAIRPTGEALLAAPPLHKKKIPDDKHPGSRQTELHAPPIPIRSTDRAGPRSRPSAEQPEWRTAGPCSRPSPGHGPSRPPKSASRRSAHHPPRRHRRPTYP